MAAKDRGYDYDSKSKTLTLYGTSGFVNWGKDGKEGIKNLNKLVMMGNIILDDAFKDCKNLISLESEGGTGEVAILYQAFKGCENLESVNIPNVVKIGREAFADCSRIGKLDLPEVEEIGKDAFKGCTELELTGLGKLKDKDDILNSGYEVSAPRIKRLFGVKLKDDKGNITGYKSFKSTCKNMCEKGVPDYGTAKGLLEIVFNELKKSLLFSAKVVETTLFLDIKGEFSDFNDIITNFNTVSNKIGAATTIEELRNVVNSYVKKFQEKLKSYVVEKFANLSKAGLDLPKMQQYLFDRYFRVLLGIAGVKKFKGVDGEVSNKPYSSFGLGGGGMDLLVKVKECELMQSKK